MASDSSQLQLTTPTHPYTILLTTPGPAVPTFLHAVQQSHLEPALLGDGCVFFRKDNPTDWPWSHILVLPGEHVTPPPAWNLKQQWHFTIESSRPFESVDAVDGFGREYLDPLIIRPRQGHGVREPEDLAATLDLWSTRHAGLCVLTLARFNEARSEARYRDAIAALRGDGSGNNKWGLQVHLAGRVTMQSSQLRSTEDVAKRCEPDALDFCTLMSFPSAKKYAEYLMSNEHADMIRGADGDASTQLNESMVLTQALQLPPKENPIDRHGWEYGNPCESYGTDWFG